MNADIYPSAPILIVDDEEEALDSFEVSLCSNGINNIVTCSDSRQVMTQLKQQLFSAVLLDLAMPHPTGDELLQQITCDFPELPVIIITGFNEVERAVDCMRQGAFDYMVKPVEGSRLSSVVRRALEFSELRRENDSLRQRLLDGELTCPEAFAEIVTANQAMHSIFKYIEAIACTQQCVLITGETGVGKELIARAVHRACNRQGKLVALNVAGVDDQMFSDALFGHEPGAFTGANGPRPGLIPIRNQNDSFIQSQKVRERRASGDSSSRFRPRMAWAIAAPRESNTRLANSFSRISSHSLSAGFSSGE